MEFNSSAPLGLRVLLTNDDGIDAEGIKALEQALSEAGAELFVVAPTDERSAASHSVTLRQPVKIFQRGPAHWAVSGTPVDTVNVGVNHILKDAPPDLIVSGINRGANLGCDIHYSGTVGAAREAALLGIPAFAISLETDREDPDFMPSARFAAELAGLYKQNHMPSRTLLNANVPDLPEDEIKGVKITVMGIRRYSDVVHEHRDDKGNTYFTIGGAPLGGEPIPGSDIMALKDGYISVTPLRLDLTNDCLLEWLEDRLGGSED